MPPPELSIILTCYNLGRSLGRAIDSCVPVLAQVPAELVIVDDGSTDETPAVCRAAQRQQGAEVIRLARHPANQGLAASCNDGLALARGRQVVRVDADDELLAAGFVEAYRQWRAEPCEIGISDYETVDAATGHVERMRPEPSNPFSVNACGVVFDRAAVLRVGGYRPMFWEEYDLLLRLEQAGARWRYAPAATYRYYRHAAAMTADAERVRTGWQELVSVWGAEALARHPCAHDILESISHGA